MTDAKESEKLRELEAIARGNGYWNHIEPFVEAFTRERDAERAVVEAAMVWLDATGAEKCARANARLASTAYEYRRKHIQSTAVTALRALEGDA